ncbi:ABC transporter ATP-binding protein [Aliarcobacter butzleri]|uniref:ABC transporter ATP-binding protein n=1 Tax=Aliarcobacter butzleri TaxID=28197 RepID=UPI00263CA6BA|nr:ABC transporter ATP-binding protein [Aliarcobacter butzleri]MDN5105452.1 ABC transporter ATP-binding protein [Aliarcobacter butzleri]
MKNIFSSIYEVYKMTLVFAGDYASSFKRSVIFHTISYVFIGLAFSMFYPLLKAIFSEDLHINQVWAYFGFMTLFSFIAIFTRWKAQNFDYDGVMIDITHKLREELGVKLRTMPLDKLFSYKTGELNSRFSSNIDEGVLLIGLASSLILQILVVPLVMILSTFFVDFRLALIMLVMFLFVIPLNSWKKRLSSEELKEFFSANAKLESSFIEYIQGLPILKSINQVGENAKSLQTSIKYVKEVQEKSVYKAKLPSAFMGIIVEFTLLALLFFGLYFVANDSLALVTLGACIVVFSRLTEPLSSTLGFIGMFDFIKLAYKRVQELLNIEPIKVYTPFETPENFDLEFKDVDFTYLNQEKKAIQNISFYIPNKSLTAIVGHSGCGKTTITKLIMRYADIQNGAITIGRANIKNMKYEDLMKNISVVFQDVYLFNDTILNNIKMANPSASKIDIENAAKSAYCHEFINKLSNGYETKIGDIGGSLSGGEKQRISIARAILKNAPIVILDEPTAALDTQSEVAVQKAIDKLVENKTVIVIAHRLSTIKDANNILVIENGSLLESGTHDELVSKKGKYFAMWEAQQRVKNWSLNERD